MRVKLLVVLAIASAVFMLLTGAASACTDTYCDGCGGCSKCSGGDNFGFISPTSLTNNVASCLTACPSSDVNGLLGVSDDLVSASGFVLPSFAGAEVGNAILSDLVVDDFSTPDLVTAGYLPSFVPVESEADILSCAVPSCVDYSSYPFLFEPNALGATCFNDLCGFEDKKVDDCGCKAAYDGCGC